MIIIAHTFILRSFLSSLRQERRTGGEESCCPTAMRLSRGADRRVEPVHHRLSPSDPLLIAAAGPRFGLNLDFGERRIRQVCVLQHTKQTAFPTRLSANELPGEREPVIRRTMICLGACHIRTRTTIDRHNPNFTQRTCDVGTTSWRLT